MLCIDVYHVYLTFFTTQMVFVSLGAHRSTRKQDGTMPPSHLPAPSRGKIPMMLLLGEPYFHQLFSLLQWLSKFRPVTQLDQQVRNIAFRIYICFFSSQSNQLNLPYNIFYLRILKYHTWKECVGVDNKFIKGYSIEKQWGTRGNARFFN